MPLDCLRHPRRLAWSFAALGLVTSFSVGNAGQSTRPAPAAPLEAIPAIIDAFESYRVVSFPGGHTDANETQALLRARTLRCAESCRPD